MKAITFSQAIADWQEAHQKALKPATLENYSSALRQFSVNIRDADPISVSTENIWKHRQGLSNQQASPKTLELHIAALKHFFRWLKASEQRIDDPSRAVAYPNVPIKAPLYLEEDQVQALRREACAWNLETGVQGKMGWRARFCIDTVLETGIKLHELMSLETRDVRVDLFNEPQLKVRAQKPRPARTFTLSRAWLDTWNGYGLALQPKDKLLKITPRALRNILKEVGSRAGVEIDFEMLRWTYIVCAVQRNIAADDLRERLALTEDGLEHVREKLKRALLTI